jgi:hypothetical protein
MSLEKIIYISTGSGSSYTLLRNCSIATTTDTCFFDTVKRQSGKQTVVQLEPDSHLALELLQRRRRLMIHGVF